MEKEFVPYEQSLALKELGFDEECFGYYDIDKGYTNGYAFCYSDVKSQLKNGCSAPLYQQAFRWFREKYDLQASNIMFSNGKSDTGITRYKGTQSVWGNGPIYDTYEEAELECLNKLIKIVKDGK